MKIEVDPRVESAIRASLPSDGSVKPLFLNGRVDAVIKQLALPSTRSGYSKEDLETLGYLTTDAMLQEITAPSEEPRRYHLKDIEILEGYVNEARGGANKVVDELSISKNAKRFIRGALDAVELHYDFAGFHETASFKGKDGGIHININVPSMFRMTSFISQNFGGELLSSSLFKGLVYYETAHEFGHAVHYALSSPQLDAPPAWHDKKLFGGYPLTMTPENTFQQSLADELFKIISHERFAQFFGWEILRGYGLSDTIRRDYIRTNAMNIFGNGFTFSQMDYIVDGCQQRLYKQEEFDVLSDKEKQNRYNLERSLIGALIIYSVSLYHTYPRATVEMLINKGWRGKRRELALAQRVGVIV
jgi:hypothetical protein